MSMKCKHCHTEKKQTKAGKTAAESQKYKHKVRGQIYTANPKKGAIANMASM